MLVHTSWLKFLVWKVFVLVSFKEASRSHPLLSHITSVCAAAAGLRASEISTGKIMASPLQPLISLLVALSLLVATVSPDRILLLMPLATKSETHLLNPIAQALLERGHTVTYVTSASSSIKHNNFTEIVPVKPLDLGDFEPGGADVLELRKGQGDILKWMFTDLSFIYERCHDTYKNPEFLRIAEDSKKFDLVLTSTFFSECFLGLIHKLQAPYILLSSMPMLKDTSDITGLRTPLSFVPNPFLEVSDKMTMSERIANTLCSWIFALFNQYHYFRIGERIYKQYLGDDLPGVEELRMNTSMVFANTHFSTNLPRPLMPDIVEIGGIHCRPAKPLPKDLDEFLSGGEKGFILFSLGTVVREEAMPKSLVQTFIKVFSRLEQRVLWKWQSDIENLPENIKISKWLPQQDVLGHPKIKLFISHGGLLSTQEATYHGVSILGIPIFADQDSNMKVAERNGYAMKLELLTMTEDVLENAIHRMLNESSFAENAKAVSALFRDQPQSPLERAVYWMEYLIKHNGAPQLRSNARNLSYWEYHMYDVQLILLAIVAGVIVLAWKITSCCLGFRGGTDDDNDERIKKRRKTIYIKKNK